MENKNPILESVIQSINNTNFETALDELIKNRESLAAFVGTSIGAYQNKECCCKQLNSKP